MSRLRELGKSIGSTLVSQVLGVVISLAFIAYFGRVLPKADMAAYAFLFTLLAWVNLFSGLGLATLAVRDTPGLVMQGRHEEVVRLITSTVFYRTAAGIVVTVFLILLAPLLSRSIFKTDHYVFEFRLIALGGLVLSALSTVSLMQWALQRFHWRAMCDLASSITTRLLAVVGYFAGGFDGFLIGTVAGGLIALALQLFSIRDYLGRHLLPVRPLFKQGAPYMGSDMLRNLLVNLDQPLVGFLLGEVALADFFVAKRCYGCFNLALQAVTGPVGAKISEARVQGLPALTRYFQNSLYLVGIIFIPAGFALAGMSEILLRMLVGAQYASASPILALYGIALVASCTYELWYDAVVRLLSGYRVMIQNAMLSVVMYGMYFVLLPLMGSEGIPLSATFAWIAATVLAASSLRREMGLTCRLGVYVRPVLCGMLVFLAVLPGWWMEKDVANFLITTASAGVAYAAGFWLFAPQEVRSLVGRLRTRLAPARAQPIEPSVVES